MKNDLVHEEPVLPGRRTRIGQFFVIFLGLTQAKLLFASQEHQLQLDKNASSNSDRDRLRNDSLQNAKGTEVIKLSAYATGLGDETEKVQAAFAAAAGRKLDLSGLTVTISGTIYLPSSVHVMGDGGFVLSGDTDYWFSAVDSEVILWDRFITRMTLSYSERTKLNRAAFFKAPKSVRFGYVESWGASTSVHCLFGERFVVERAVLRNVQGVLPQYGYGINSSARFTEILDLDAENSDGSQGRHAIYINGSQWLTALIGRVRVRNWNKNPIQIVGTSAGLRHFCKIDAVEFDRCNLRPLKFSTGCVHVSDENLNTRIEIGSITAVGCAGGLLSNLARGDGGMTVGSIRGSSLLPAGVLNVNVVYCRSGSNKSVDMIEIDSLPSNWEAVINFRDGVGYSFKSVTVGGVSGKYAVILNGGAVSLGTVKAPGMPKVRNMRAVQIKN